MQLQMILRRSLLPGFASSGAPAAFSGEAAAGLSLGLGGAATAAATGLAAPGATGSSALGILDSPRRLMERSRKILLPIEQANINDARWLCQLSRRAGSGLNLCCWLRVLLVEQSKGHT